MQFNGYLETLPLPDLAQLIANGRKSGTLVLSRGGEVVRFVFRDGSLVGTLCGSNGTPDEDLPARLVRGNLLTRSESEVLLELARRRGNTITETLTAIDLLRPDDLDQALYDRTLQFFSEIMEWRDGSFDFRQSEDDELALAGQPRRVDELLLHAF